MTTASARIHVSAGDKATARYVTDGDIAHGYVVVEWDAPNVSLFLPADVATLDQFIAQVQLVRDGVAMSTDLPALCPECGQGSAGHSLDGRCKA